MDPSLTAWKAYEFCTREINTPLFTVIWRGGVLFCHFYHERSQHNYIYHCGQNVTSYKPNVCSFLFWLSRQIIFIIGRSTLIFEIVLSCRLLLNLRGMNEKASSNVLIKPALGRSDLFGSEGSKLGARGTQSAHRDSPGIFEMTQPPPIRIPYSWSVDVFPAYDINVKAEKFLDIGKQSFGWLR